MRSRRPFSSVHALRGAALQLLRRIDRLSVRLALGIAVLVIAPLGVGIIILSRHHYDHTIEIQRRAADLQNRILEVTLRHGMVEKDRRLIASILDEIGAQPEVREARILDHEGVVRHSSDPDAVGARIPKDSATCRACHSRPAGERSRWILADEAAGDLLRSVRPIENRPECHGCHDPEQRLNGILILDTSLAEVRAGLQEDATMTFGATAVVALMLLLGVGLVIRRLVLGRLTRLRRAARGIAAGDLERRAPVEGRDVITALSAEFNRMADSVSRLVSEVRERESQLMNVMNSLDDGLVVLDRDQRVVAANRSFCRRLQTHPEVLRGRRCRDAAREPLPCCAADGACPTQRCMTSGEVQRSTFRVEAGDGSPDLVEEVYASPVFDEEGEVVQVVEIWRNISERVREEEHLAEIERLVSLGVLASGFSHEVNTPLASMLACAEAVRNRVDEGTAAPGASRTVLAEIGEYADLIRRQVHRCRRITDQFLRFSRGIPPSVEAIDLREAVAGVVTLVEPTARETGVSIDLEGTGRLPPVRANTEVVQHVLLNLLVNALQSFDAEGGRIAIAFHADGDVRVRIRDSGCGIPTSRRQHLFEPFRTDKPRGTGLGLFLSRNSMRRFAGDVRLVESEVGVGSCFEVIFARAGGSDVAGVEGPSPAAARR